MKFKPRRLEASPISKDEISQARPQTLIVGLHYAPEVTGNAPYTSGLATGLARDGWDVRVLAGYPHYPEWRVHDGYGGASLHEEIDSVAVTRLRHHVPAKPNFLSRLHMELSFGLRAALAHWERVDVVLAVSPALFATALVVVKARLTGRAVGVWVQDLYSRGMEEAGGGPSVAARVVKAIERAVLRGATGITVIHDSFARYVVEDLGIPTERVRVIRNWTHVRPDDGVDREVVRTRLGWQEHDVVALHAGNMGLKQNLENVVAAAAAAERADSKVRFVLLGHGNQRDHLEEIAQGVAKVGFMDPLPEREFAEAVKCADVLIVNELPGVREMSVPSKLTSYFAAGVPVVAATEPDSATAGEVRASRAGVVVPSGNPERLLRAVEDVAADSVAASAMAAAGPAYVDAVLGEGAAIAAYEEWLGGLTASRKRLTSRLSGLGSQRPSSASDARGKVKKTAFITGITGQDGSYLAELLLRKGYVVHGLIRRSSTFNTARIDHLYVDPHDVGARLFLHYGDLSDGARLVTLMAQINPDEVYNLAAQSHVRVSFDEPEHTGNTTGIGTVRLLEAMRMANVDARFYQASTSELFGATPPPQDEETPFHPRSPYGVAKMYSYWITKNYREAYGMFAVNGILFNHESPRRGETFVTRKITRAVAAIKAGLQDALWMGNLDAIRDWGYAPEYVEGMWRMLQVDEPEDFVLATGEGYSVKDFLQVAFEHADLDWEEHVRFDPRYLRPAEVDALIGQPAKAQAKLGWKAMVHTPELARLMVDADIEILKNGGRHWVDTVNLQSWES